jgi:putative methionine-R-sulfoxide reductase with GAF domain
MTQQPPLPTEEQVPAEDTKLAENRVFQVAAILFGGHILATFFLFFFAVQLGSWQIYAMAGVLTVSNAIYFAALRILRKSRLETAGWMFITAMLVDIIAGPLLISGSGIVLGFIFVAAAYLIASQTLPAKYTRQILAVSIGVGILLALTDFLNLDYRLQAPALKSFTPIIAVIVLLPAVFIIIRYAWSRSLTISRKLFIVFSILFVFALAIAALGLYGLNRVQNAYENTLAGGVKILNRADDLNSALLKARRREKDFLLQWKVDGFASAYTSDVAPYNDHIVTMKDTLDELSALAPVLGRVPLRGYSQEQYTSDIASMQEDVLVYEQSFTKVVFLIQERGFEDTGLEGDFRIAVHDIEAKIYDRQGLDKLVITMLQIRRREKDYLLRGDQQYVDNVHDLVAELKSEAAASDVLTPTEQQEIVTLADAYLVKFDALVEKDKEVAATSEVFRAVATRIQTSADRLAGVGEDLAALDVQTAQTNSTQTIVISIITVLVVLIASIVLAVILSRVITRPVIQLTNTAAEIAAGKFDVVAEISSGDEIGTLAKTFNIMTERLGAAFEDVRRRAAELATVAEVSTATSTILETKSLLQEVVDLTKERFNLYHSHIYLLDDKGEDLVLTAGAGEPGRIMVTEGRSIPLSREQSLVARAARERKGVTVNDVTQAADFLPNPLLPDTRSELAVPMVVGGNMIGVFDIQSEQVGRFTDSDVNIQTTLAAQLATSVQNVRSFEQSKKEAELESMVNAIGQRIQRTTSIEETLQTAIRELGTALGATRVSANIQAVSSQSAQKENSTN